MSARRLSSRSYRRSNQTEHGTDARRIPALKISQLLVAEFGEIDGSNSLLDRGSGFFSRRSTRFRRTAGSGTLWSRSWCGSHRSG